MASLPPKPTAAGSSTPPHVDGRRPPLRSDRCLALAGQRGITLHDSPACLADLQILEARARAALGETASATKAVARAESTFNQVTQQNEPEWARFIDAAYIHHHAVGRDHRPWYDEQRPEPFAAALRAAKHALDPAGILSPGVLTDA